jgi:hypothetical protein
MHRTASNFFTCSILLVFVGGNTSFSQDVASNGSSESKYQQIEAQFNDLAQKLVPASRLEQALRGVFASQVLQNTNKTNWPAIRFKTAQAILTNLCQLEAGIQQTQFITTTNVAPPDHMSMPSGSPIGAITNTAERAEMSAYQKASMAFGRLWNMHQELETTSKRYKEAGIDLMVSLYKAPPVSDVDIKSLVRMYSSNNCVIAFTNRLSATQNRKVVNP